jgi:hypothetical protein
MYTVSKKTMIEYINGISFHVCKVSLESGYWVHKQKIFLCIQGCPKISESVKTDFITVQSFHEYKYENVCMYVICLYVFMNEWSMNKSICRLSSIYPMLSIYISLFIPVSEAYRTTVLLSRSHLGPIIV